MGKIQKSRPKLQRNQEQDSKYNPIQSNHDLRIKLEHELYQKVRQAVHTPPRERIIRRRLNEFQYEIQKRLKIEEEKKKLAIQMNDLINLGITNTTESFISSLNNITKINCIDLRMHPESYYQNLKWYKTSNINMKNQNVLWNNNNNNEIGLLKNERKELNCLLVTKNSNYDDDDQTSFFNEMDIMNEDTTDTNPSSLYHLNNSLTKNYLPNHHHVSNKPFNTTTNTHNNHSLSNNTTYSQYIINKFHNYKNTIINLKPPIFNQTTYTTTNTTDNTTTASSMEYTEHDPLLNDEFTFNWNIDYDYDLDQTINNNNNNNNNNIMDHINQYYELRQHYITEEDLQVVYKYYNKFYENKLSIINKRKKSIKNNNNNLLTRQMIMEKFGRLTDNEKQLFYFSATRAAYLIASIQSQHKLPDGTQFRLINQSNKKPLDYVKINNLFINQTINDPSNKINNHNNTNQTSNGSLYTLPTLIDWNSVVRDRHGPFWPHNYGPICQTLYNLYIETNNSKDDYNVNKPIIPDYTEEIMQLRNKQPYFKGIRVIFDSECSPCLSGDSSTSTSPSLDIKQFVEELTNVQQWTPPCLVFESRFESGNLRQVRRIGPFHYELLLKPDLYTKRHVQWYFFRIQNILPGFIYTFLIINFTKSTSLQPLLYSKINYQQNGKKWIRVGRNIKYTRNTMNLSNHLLDTNGEYYQLEWEMEFPYSNDICYLAYSYPYTYTNLKFDINELLMKSKENDLLNKTINCDVLCQTRADIPNKDKYAVIITARVHPGETNSSWITLGLLKFLTSNQSVSLALKKHYVFYIIPMLNPDGVIVGNYRCSLTGRDLNRNYRQPRKDVFPTVWTVKQLVKWCKKTYKDVIYCDIHGHSRRNNIFMYGCDPLYRHSKIFNHTKQTLHERILPYILSQQATSYFSFPNCRFTIHPSKEATSRVVFWREFEVINSFTLEATFNGSTLQNNNLIKFEVDDFLKMGELLGDSLYRFHEVLSNPLKLKETLINLARQTLTNLWMNKIPLMPKNTITEEYKDNLSIFNKKSYNSIKLQLYTTNKELLISTTTTTNDDDQFNDKSILNQSLNLFNNDNHINGNGDGDDDGDDGDNDHDNSMNDSLEQLAKTIHYLEKSIEFHTTEFNDNELSNIKDNHLSCTSDSNSDSEPEMTITAQNSLNQYHHNDLILPTMEQYLTLDQGKPPKTVDDNNNRSYKLKKRKKIKKKKLQAFRHHHHHRHHQSSSIQQQSYKNISSNEHHNNGNSTHNSKLLSSKSSSSSSSSTSPPMDVEVTSSEQIDDHKRQQFKSEIMEFNSQNHNERLNRRLYYLSKYAGQSNNGIPCFVEKRLFHRSCQRIRTVCENIDLTKSQTIHAQRKFVQQFINNLETKMSNLRRTDNLTNIDVLKYLKQIHLIAKRQLQLIQSQFIPITDKNHPYKPTTIHETVPNGIGIPYPPPLPVFTTTGRQIKTHSATITTNGDAVKRNISIIGDIERKSNHLIPRSRSCNLFLRNNHNNYRNQNNNKLLELPKIVEKLSENNMIHHSRNNYNILNGIDMKV
uniref:Pepdidase_M14_N domain-containing protein n=1 Tax=Schistosoma mansoni TaxID=6183 RepID=A0A5K4FEP0_SCHMA